LATRHRKVGLPSAAADRVALFNLKALRSRASRKVIAQDAQENLAGLHVESVVIL
jgi:hypothetical protein